MHFLINQIPVVFKPVRKYLLTSSENFQDLELRKYVKENLADMLFRGEKADEYVSKQFKQKKKKRHYKGI